MEVQVRKIEHLILKTNSMDDSVKQLMANVGQAHESQLFSERYMPMMIHLQLMDGLNKLVTNETQKVQVAEFDKKQIKDLHHYMTESEGYPVNLKQLRMRLGHYTRYLLEQNQGSLPFRYGVFKDYWHSINENQLTKFEKKKDFPGHRSQIDVAVIKETMKYEDYVNK